MTRGRALAAALLAACTALTGCSTLGGNVKGSFSCVAPDGICAPSSTIDDRALSLISGEDGDRMVTPAGPYVEPPKEGRGFQTAAAPARTSERVLRIVFPAQIDAAGRLHEQTAVHAVVEQGEWQQALAGNAVATTPQQVASVTGGDTLLAAVERADPPTADIAELDPDLPSDAAIKAARSQAGEKRASTGDPIGEVKDQVSRRLSAPRRPSTRSSGLKPAATITQGVGATAATSPTPSSARPVRTDAAGASATVVPARASEAGKAAISAVNGNPAIRSGLARAEPEARAASKDAKPLPVLRASSFPGVQP